MGFFAISIGPLGWLIVSEVFPQKLRGLGASLGSLSVWFFNAIVSFTFFKILKVFSIPGTELTINGESQGNPGGSVLVLCAYWNFGDYFGIFLCSGNERGLVGKDRGFLEKRGTSER